jgi:hypothetical protein
VLAAVPDNADGSRFVTPGKAGAWSGARASVATITS